MNAAMIAISASRISSRTPMKQTAVNEAYTRAVQAAGGLPVLIPNHVSDAELEQIFARVDGVLLTGGGDINPRHFRGKPHERIGDVDDDRDRVEIGLARLAVEHGKPLMGICRGCQVLNVALGGTLYTDIQDQLPGALRHDWYPDIPRDTLAHSVRLEGGSRLQGIIGADETPVNSLHHQGLEQVAPALKAVAWAPDGLVEAVELAGHPFGLAVQWHPEWLQAHAPMRALFAAFVAAAAQE